MADDTQIPPPPQPDPALARYQAEITKLQGEKAALTAAASADAGRLAAQLARSRVEIAAREAGLVNPNLVGLLPIDKVKVDIATGTVTGVEEAIAAWRTSVPEIFKTKTEAPPPPPTTPAGDPPPPPPPAPPPPATGFGPGLAQAGDTQPPPFDARKADKKDYQAARDNLRQLAAQADGAASAAADSKLRNLQ